MSLLRVDWLCLEAEAASARLKTLFADFEVETVLYLLTMIRIVLPGMAGVGAAPLIKWAILSIDAPILFGWVGGRAFPDFIDWEEENGFLI